MGSELFLYDKSDIFLYSSKSKLLLYCWLANRLVRFNLINLSHLQDNSNHRLIIFDSFDRELDYDVPGSIQFQLVIDNW